jgi:hypothetical protein
LTYILNHFETSLSFYTGLDYYYSFESLFKLFLGCYSLLSSSFYYYFVRKTFSIIGFKTCSGFDGCSKHWGPKFIVGKAAARFVSSYGKIGTTGCTVKATVLLQNSRTISLFGPSPLQCVPSTTFLAAFNSHLLSVSTAVIGPINYS